MLRPGEISVDFFAGGGGASQGIERAIGRPVDVAINHDPDAIAMHAANHPNTLHIQESVWKADASFLRGKNVGLAWFSPDCKHFSRAKGTKPVDKKIRSLAWVVTWFVKKCKQLTRDQRGPRIIILENVREFEDWGPLVPCWHCAACQWKGTEGQATLARSRRRCPRCESVRLSQTDQELPDPDRKGLTFRRFVGTLRGLGYHVEWKVLNAADYGAPTHRRRLFLVARNDGQPVVWPDATHGDPKKIGLDLFNGDLKPWRTAAECIDWSISCPSIFTRKKPLAEKTLKRIALGIKRYVLDNPKPFIVGVGGRAGQTPPTAADAPVGTVTSKNDRGVVVPIITPLTHDGERRSQSPNEPLPTITGANRGEFAAVVPHLTKFRTGAVGSGIDEPMPTVTANSFIKRPGGAAPLGLVEATVAPFLYPRNGEFPGQTPRCQSVESPLNTVTVDGNSGQLATAFLSKICQNGSNGDCTASVENPLSTVVSKNEHLLVCPTLMPHYGKSVAAKVNGPLPTITAGGQGKQALCAAFIAKHFGGVVGHTPERPLGTVTAVDHHSLVAANLVHMHHGGGQHSGADEPIPTVTSQGNHAGLVYSFLVKYFGQGVGVEVDVPCPTVTTKDRFGLVFVYLDGEPYVIVDIGMRMLRPKELARAQGFHRKTIFTGTATSQVARIGNSVPPDLAFAVADANVSESAVAA